jgi:hypothetical protein
MTCELFTASARVALSCSRRGLAEPRARERPTRTPRTTAAPIHSRCVFWILVDVHGQHVGFQQDRGRGDATTDRAVRHGADVSARARASAPRSSVSRPGCPAFTSNSIARSRRGTAAAPRRSFRSHWASSRVVLQARGAWRHLPSPLIEPGRGVRPRVCPVICTQTPHNEKPSERPPSCQRLVTGAAHLPRLAGDCGAAARRARGRHPETLIARRYARSHPLDRIA